MNKIEFCEKLSPYEEAKMASDFDQYERSQGIRLNFKTFAITMKDATDELIGVLKGYTAFGEVYIDDLWVETSHRGKGLGRQLLIYLEKRFTGEGFNNMNLVTSAFGAPGFYQKCGFDLEFVRKNNINPLLTKFFFVKYFPDKVQSQGTIEKHEA